MGRRSKCCTLSCSSYLALFFPKTATIRNDGSHAVCPVLLVSRQTHLSLEGVHAGKPSRLPRQPGKRAVSTLQCTTYLHQRQAGMYTSPALKQIRNPVGRCGSTELQLMLCGTKVRAYCLREWRHESVAFDADWETEPALQGFRPCDSSAEVEGIAALEDAFNNCIEALLRQLGRASTLCLLHFSLALLH